MSLMWLWLGWEQWCSFVSVLQSSLSSVQFFKQEGLFHGFLLVHQHVWVVWWKEYTIEDECESVLLVRQNVVVVSALQWCQSPWKSFPFKPKSLCFHNLSTQPEFFKNQGFVFMLETCPFSWHRHLLQRPITYHSLSIIPLRCLYHIVWYSAHNAPRMSATPSQLDVLDSSLLDNFCFSRGYLGHSWIPLYCKYQKW